MLLNKLRRTIPALTAGTLFATAKKGFCEGESESTIKSPSFSKDLLRDDEKIIHLVRHAKGAHNAAAEFDYSAYKREDLEDALLTEEGVEQCFLLAEESEFLADAVELVVVSPMNRTIQTAIYGFPNLLGRVPWIARPEVRETMGQHPCDRMAPVSQKIANYPDIDFKALDGSDRDDAYYSYNDCREPLEDIEMRGRSFIEWLSSRPEKEIVVVTHSGFLLTFVNRVLRDYAMDFSERHGEEFRNAELRTFIVKVR